MYKSLKDFYGVENCFTSGNPQFSFFARVNPQFSAYATMNERIPFFSEKKFKSPFTTENHQYSSYTSKNPRCSFIPTGNHVNYFDYMKALNKNQILTHTNFCRNNFKYEVSNHSKQYILKINDILDNDQHHLLHGITIYLPFGSIQSISNIQLKIGDIVLDYDLCILSFINEKYSQIFYDFEEKRLSYIKLPIELFECTNNWINLINNIPIDLIINLDYPMDIRVDFSTITLDSEEKRILNLKSTKAAYECIIRHNEKMEFAIKDIDTDNKIIFDLSNIRDGIKELSLFFKCDNNFIDNVNLIESVKLCVNNNGNKIEIEQDTLQLLCSNKQNTGKKNCIYEFPLALFPESSYSSGDFFVNNFNVSLIISIGKIPKKIYYDNVSLVLVINKMKIIKYYIDENDNCKCKWNHLEEIYNEFNMIDKK